MNKVKEIILSYAVSMNPTEDQKEIAERRLTICMDCDEWAKDALVQHCRLCGCVTKIKIFSPRKNSCPKEKWLV